MYWLRMKLLIKFGRIKKPHLIGFELNSSDLLKNMRQGARGGLEVMLEARNLGCGVRLLVIEQRCVNAEYRHCNDGATMPSGGHGSPDGVEVENVCFLFGSDRV